MHTIQTFYMKKMRFTKRSLQMLNTLKQYNCLYLKFVFKFQCQVNSLYNIHALVISLYKSEIVY